MKKMMTGFGLVVAALAISGAASADTPEPWQPYVEGDLTLPAERYCGFEVIAHPEYQKIQSQVLDRYEDGAVRTEQYRGPLLSRFTNQETGAEDVVDLGGRALATYTPEGKLQRYETWGPVGVGYPAGAGDALLQGYYRLSGHHVVTFNADGSRDLTVDEGPELNICTLID
ncbi:hypothetical protein [Aeromicrobium sp.]|uniref:hypothetical protein n=1 Tax=Aeromicrobium sp. TaxID=1871063 RepID=UPI003D6A1548